MGKSLRIGVLGLTHDHVWSSLTELRDTGKAELVGAAESHELLRERVRKEHGCATYDDCQKLLEKERPDAVYIYADNAAGAELAVQAAQRGIHVLIEKPMAADLPGAERMLAAARLAKVRLMVNWPFASWPQLRHGLHLAQGGAIGDLWQVKYRAAHAGPREMGCSAYFCDWLVDAQRNGGGALMDYCCYGVVLARCLLGMPSRVQAVAGRFCKEDILVEDNALVVMTYPRGLALAEGSWTQVGKLTAYQTAIHGTQGTILVEPRRGGRLWLATADQPEGTILEVPESAPEWRSASAHFLHALETGEPFHPLCQDRICRDVQEILEAGRRAAQHGREVTLPLNVG